MRNILAISLVVVALCCACKSKERLVIENTEKASLEVRHEAIDYIITISDIEVNNSGDTVCKPVRKIEVKGEKKDTASCVMREEKTTVNKDEESKKTRKRSFLLVIIIIVCVFIMAILVHKVMFKG